ncbi:MAG: DUF3575 domain-containing protein [Bacteroidales bacterium]
MKTNLLYDATSTFNIELEAGISSKWTLSLPVNYNPWIFAGNHKFKHWLAQPEVRYWFCEKFNGSFVGLHAHAGGYNVGGIKLFGTKDYRYEGRLYGAGFSYGRHWILNTHWSLEATIGIGFARMHYRKYPCERCAAELKDATRYYFGPTKAGVSLIYLIK